MELKSLGYRTQVIFADFDGLHLDRGDHLAIHTLSNPNFFWGNLLIFERPPKRGDFAIWREKFQKEFTNPKIYHMTFAWDSVAGETGDVTEFLENGFALEKNAVLSAQAVVAPPHLNADVVVRPIQSVEEWEEMIQIQIRSASDDLPLAEWESFYRAQSARYQAMEADGRGHWYGAFLDDSSTDGNKERLVGGLGIYHLDGLARFQSVSTDPEFQRRGVCQTLVYKASLLALESKKISTLVMCADPEYHAIRIYESVGFKRHHLDHGVYWWDRAHSG